MGQRKGLGCLRKVFRDQGSIQSGLLSMSKIGILRGKIKLRMASTSSKKKSDTVLRKVFLSGLRRVASIHKRNSQCPQSSFSGSKAEPFKNQPARHRGLPLQG